MPRGAYCVDNNNRLHFGVIFGAMDDTGQYDIWMGIIEFAQKNDILLTAYFGAYEITDGKLAFHIETCVETILNSDSLDGVIVLSGFIDSTIGNAELEKYIVRIAGRLPLISV